MLVVRIRMTMSTASAPSPERLCTSSSPLFPYLIAGLNVSLFRLLMQAPLFAFLVTEYDALFPAQHCFVIVAFD